ncbi:hypothetical protein ACWDKQ_00175 [Saccharopolyspora sp. NPDC000995]
MGKGVYAACGSPGPWDFQRRGDGSARMKTLTELENTPDQRRFEAPSQDWPRVILGIVEMGVGIGLIIAGVLFIELDAAH